MVFWGHENPETPEVIGDHRVIRDHDLHVTTCYNDPTCKQTQGWSWGMHLGGHVKHWIQSKAPTNLRAFPGVPCLIYS